MRMDSKIGCQDTSFSSDLPLSIKRLITSLQSQRVLDPNIARQLVIDAKIHQEDLLTWADFSHSVADSYGRKLVYDGGNFEIIVMSWLPGDFSAIHDHGSTQWGAVQCFGSGEHWVYKLKNQVLSTHSQTAFPPGTVVAVNHDLIHQMGNPSESPFLSLHVYGCENSHGSITGDARIFELWEGCIQYTDGGVFFALPEDQINTKVYGLKGDCQTTLHHLQCLRDRLKRILSVWNNSPDSLLSQLTLIEEKIALLSFTKD